MNIRKSGNIFTVIIILFILQLPFISYALQSTSNEKNSEKGFRPYSMYAVNKANGDGSHTMRLYNNPINYFDKKTGEWKPINVKIVKLGNISGVETGLYKAYFYKDHVETAEDDRRAKIYFLAAGNTSPGKPTLDIKGNKATYKYRNGIDVAYVYTETGLKQNMILKEKPRIGGDHYIVKTKIVFNERVEAYADDEKMTSTITSKAVQFKNQRGETVLKLPKPIAFEKDNSRSQTDCEYDIGVEGKQAFVSIRTPYSWLSEKERTYPILIDPEMEKFGQGIAPDSYIVEGSINSNYGSDTDLLVRKNGGNNARAIIRFDLSGLPSDSKLTDAKLYLYCYEKSDTLSLILDIHRVTSSPDYETLWTEAGVTWGKYDGTNDWPTPGGNYGTKTSNTTVYGISTWYAWNVTSDCSSPGQRSWILKDSLETGTAEYRKFYSKEYTGDTSLRPYMQITYISDILQPSTADAEIRQRGDRPWNYGTCASAKIQTWADLAGQGNRRFLVEFDVSGIASEITAGATLKSAHLMLYKYGSVSIASGDKAQAYRVTKDWDEGAVSCGSAGECDWDLAKTGVSWTTPGGDYTATGGSEIDIPTSDNVWMDFDVKDIVYEWVKQTSPEANYGFIVKWKVEDSGSEKSFQIIAREHATTTQRPKLEVDLEYPTAVRLISFKAHQYEDHVKVVWHTGYEVDNLGFNVYREEGGKLYQLTPELIAGSALLAGSGTALTAGRHYVWWDLLPEGTNKIRYYLEDVDLNGKRTMHGPVTPVESEKPLLGKAKPELLSELGMKLAGRYQNYWRIQNLKDRLNLKRLATQDRGALRSRIALLKASAPQGNEVPDPLSLRSKADHQAQPSERNRMVQWFLASRPAVKILVKEEGWYRVSQPELVTAGLDPRIKPRNLQLYVDGKEQPIRVIGEGDGRFNPQDAIEFYGSGLDTPSTDTKVYWLVLGSSPGKRIQISNGRGGSLGPASFPFSIEKKERMIYFPTLKNGEKENFFGAGVLMAKQAEQLLNISHLDLGTSGSALLEVALQGVTNVSHRVRVLINHAEIGEIVFEGQGQGLKKFTVPQSELEEGDNLVTLIAQGGDTDVSLVNYIRLTYWHTYTVDEDALKFTVQGGKQLSVNGFSNPKIQVIDITNSEAMLEVIGKIESQKTGYGITFKAPGYGNRTLLAFTTERIAQPLALLANQPSAWNQTNQRADLLVIAHGDFLSSLRPLKSLRERQGYSVALIDVEDLYDEFNFGAKSPFALRDFLSYAKQQWRRPPRFVLLVGDASLDPRNYLGLGDFDFVPTKMIETGYLETASDDWFVDFNGDGLPEVAIGRLPLQTVEEATTVVSKIIGYEQSGKTSLALFVADINDGFNFEAASEEVKNLLPAHIGVRKIFRDEFSSGALAKEELLNSINQGPLLVNYLGHGSVELWRGGLFNSDDAEGLINGQHLSFFINMTCLNGFFQDLYADSLSESLLKAKNGGAIAVWASSGLTDPGDQLVMNKEIVRLLFNGESLTLGQAVARAKRVINDGDVRRTWIFFGDPTTKLK